MLTLPVENMFNNDSIEITGKQFQQDISVELAGNFLARLNKEFYKISCIFNRFSTVMKVYSNESECQQ